jgi:hypothetical protein
MTLAMDIVNKAGVHVSRKEEEGTMARQMLKGMTMLLMVVALSLVAAVVSANGQSSQRQVANIPFNFTIGDKNMPAGRYDVSQVTSGGEAIRVRDTQGTRSAIRLSNLMVKTNPTERAKLVFRRYGKSYFLAEVWSAGYANGRRLLKSDGEEAAKSELAADQKKYERVEIALVRE